MTSGRVEERKEWKSISISISNIRYLLSEGQVRHSKLMITGCPESKFSDAFRRLQSHTSALKSRLPRIIVSRCHPICLTKIEQVCLPAHSCHGHDDGTALRCACPQQRSTGLVLYFVLRRNDHARTIMLLTPAADRSVTPALCFVPYLHLSGEQAACASLQWLSWSCPITTQKCPGNASSTFVEINVNE